MSVLLNKTGKKIKHIIKWLIPPSEILVKTVSTTPVQLGINVMVPQLNRPCLRSQAPLLEKNEAIKQALNRTGLLVNEHLTEAEINLLYNFASQF